MIRKIKSGKKKIPVILKDKLAEKLIREMRDRVAVYIDAANLEKSVQALGLTPPKHFRKGMSWRGNPSLWQVDYKKLRQFFRLNAKLASISFYSARFGTKSHDRFLTFLKNNGYRLVTKPVKTIFGGGRKVTCEQCGYKKEIPDERKANFDVEISADAVSWINEYDTFVLFSGDSDFVYLFNFLKRQGKRVIVLSRRGHVAYELRISKDIDCYEDIWKLRDKLLRKKPLRKPKPRSHGA